MVQGEKRPMEGEVRYKGALEDEKRRRSGGILDNRGMVQRGPGGKGKEKLYVNIRSSCV